MTTFNYTFDTTYPDGSVLPGSILDDSDRLIKQAIQERENVDHYWPLTGTQVSDAKAGEHRKVQFYGVLTVKPVLAAGECALYLKTVAAKSELFFENEGGTEVQLTSVGSLSNIVLQTGTQTIAGAKTFTDGIVVNTQISGTAITDEDDMASDSAVKVPTEQSVKAYVDAQTVQKYDSGWFAGALTTTYTKAHGLGAVPTIVQVFYGTASDGSGDVVPVSFEVYGTGAYVNGGVIGLDATNVIVRVEDSMAYYTNSSGDVQKPTAGYFKIVALLVN